LSTVLYFTSYDQHSSKRLETGLSWCLWLFTNWIAKTSMEIHTHTHTHTNRNTC